MDEMKKNKMDDMEMDGVTGGASQYRPHTEQRHYHFQEEPPKRGGKPIVLGELANKPIDLGEPGNGGDIIKNLKP